MPRGSISVWPGYVAAVSSLVLSLLLLAGVLVVSISQAGRLMGEYNRQLISAAIDDQRRIEEIERLSQVRPPAPARPLAQVPAPAVQALAPRLEAPSASFAVSAGVIRQPGVSEPLRALPPSTAAVRLSPVRLPPAELDAQALALLQSLERDLQARGAELSRAQSEWLRLQAEVRAQAARPAAPEPEKLFRLVYGSSAQQLDAAALRQLRQQIEREGGLDGPQRWALEVGIKGVDAVAEREIYRLMLGLRTQMQEMGISADRVRVVMNRERGLQDGPGGRSSLQGGDVPVILRRDVARGQPS